MRNSLNGFNRLDNAKKTKRTGYLKTYNIKLLRMKNREFLKTERIMSKESQSNQNNNKQSNIYVS